MDRHIYIFEEKSKSILYGIGTYIGNIITLLKETNISITVVSFYNDKEILEVTKNENVRYIYFPFPKYKKINKDYYYRNCFYILANYISKNELNIGHFNYFYSNNIITLLKIHFNFKTILTWHYSAWRDWISDNKLNNILYKLEQKVTLNNVEEEIWNVIRNESELLNNCYDRIIVLSNQSNIDLKKIYNVSSSKIIMIRNCIKDLHDKSEYQYSSDHFKNKIILFVGRIDKNKNLSLLIEAFQQLKNTNKNASLVIIGSGNYDEVLPYVGLKYSNIYFTGFLSSSNLNKLYSQAYLGVIPSLHEESPYVAIEMLMHGIPVISNNIGSLSEIIVNRKNGFLLNIASSDRKRASILLSRKINTILSNTKLHELLSRNARDSYKKKHDIQMFNTCMFELYNNL